MSQTQNKRAVLRRLARLEGQVRGVTRMVEDERDCVDVLKQTAAIRSALKGVERLLIDDHARRCVDDAVTSGSADAQREALLHLVALMDKTRAG
ncbi:metal-sensitive transcriptional regulator [Acuticoccus sp. I52.16.1]|uniref:metal-sensitive transcriptional regulator n=1 Tax=Acuticoccus sp. I52.16.1 TaxID=2928472 RepID=UPI001FD53DBE|nr:metal-sensitive transcriptional regulator [Acuticoccus sp. I52.16.1]UOM33567.1 metal-sensitive transcriptional regulator [Acuticoccus sp. I52.16.1]